MKLIFIRSNIKDGLSVVERGIGEHQNLPILKNVLIETKENKIQLTTTNLDVAITCVISGKIIENGSVTIPLHTLSNLINNLTSERINFEKKQQSLVIKTDNYQATIQGMPPEEFPIIPKLENKTHYINIRGDIFKEALQQINASAQFSELRPELNSVLLIFSLDALKIVATDSFRLSEKTLTPTQFTSTYPNEFKILIPLKTIHELSRIISNDEVVQIFHDQNQLLFKTNRFELISRLIEGNFPDYQTVIPKKFETEIILSRRELIDAVKVASVFSSRVYEIKINVPEGKRTVEVFSADQAMGENTYLLPAKVNGRGKGANFNWRYLLDGLKALQTDDIFFGLNEENKPALLKAVNETSYFYILMPILKT